MRQRKFIDGNSAVAYGVMVSRADVVAAYPITPQTKIVEKISELIADGLMDTEYIKVESEHSAMSACVGAAATGVRTFTATSSQGLAYMQEMLHYASGGRLPVVMAAVNRTLAPPWNIWGDHQDTISARDTGWIQLYVETGQEALDTTIQAFRIAEDPSVLTPVMLCLDAFVLSHTEEVIEIPTFEQVDQYLPPLRLKNTLDVDNPKTLCAGATPDYTMEYRFAQQKGIENARVIIDQANREFEVILGRGYGGLVDYYRTGGAQAVLLVLGSLAGTIRDVVDEMRAEGFPVGLMRVRAFRPFPTEAVRQIAADTRCLGVVDRDLSFGNGGALYTEVKAALYGGPSSPSVRSFIAGLGGRDVTKADIRQMFVDMLQVGAPEPYPAMQFTGLKTF